MPRKGPAPKRVVAPDPVYNNRLAAKFINRMLVQGKRSVAERRAMKNVMPVVEVKPRRVGGATYQVPIEVRPDRRQALGIRWLVMYSRRRSGRTMIERLAGELLDAANGQGASVKKREDSHRMAEANKAFGHYRW
jgi:small subunit ribosomal protein S7